MKKVYSKYGWGLLLFLLLTGTGCKKKPVSSPPEKASPVTEQPAAPAQPPETRFYVITGSFLQPENVQRYEERMRAEGFSPRQLPGDAGFHRVAVFAFDNEPAARQKLHEVRASGHPDAWLLITRE